MPTSYPTRLSTKLSGRGIHTPFHLSTLCVDQPLAQISVSSFAWRSIVSFPVLDRAAPHALDQCDAYGYLGLCSMGNVRLNGHYRIWILSRQLLRDMATGAHSFRLSGVVVDLYTYPLHDIFCPGIGSLRRVRHLRQVCSLRDGQYAHGLCAFNMPQAFRC